MMAKTTSEPKVERNIDGYGAPQIPWQAVRALLEKDFDQIPGSSGPGRHTWWLATVRPDGRPHVMPLGLLWLDGAFYFSASLDSRKARNLAQNPHCTVTVATHDFDLVVEGNGARVTDPALIKRVAEAFVAQGWPARVTDDGLALTAEYSAPSAGPPPWYVYEVTLESVFALGTAEPYGAANWRF